MVADLRAGKRSGGQCVAEEVRFEGKVVAEVASGKKGREERFRDYGRGIKVGLRATAMSTYSAQLSTTAAAALAVPLFTAAVACVCHSCGLVYSTGR
ncbi:hypothetical protein ZWY2020_050045 [Hordeum vulgare]|nr:hypothetical protein ZWY2020_050045 [Hordeum vulgare]